MLSGKGDAPTKRFAALRRVLPTVTAKLLVDRVNLLGKPPDLRVKTPLMSVEVLARRLFQGKCPWTH